MKQLATVKYKIASYSGQVQIVVDASYQNRTICQLAAAKVSREIKNETGINVSTMGFHNLTIVSRENINE